MTAQEAYKIIYKNHKLERIRNCLDFGKFYVFCFTPIDVKNDDNYYTGTEFEAVDKKTGKIFIYDITSNLSLYERAKEVKVNDALWDRSISSLEN